MEEGGGGGWRFFGELGKVGFAQGPCRGEGEVVLLFSSRKQIPFKKAEGFNRNPYV